MSIEVFANLVRYFEKFELIFEIKFFNKIFFINIFIKIFLGDILNLNNYHLIPQLCIYHR